MLGPTLFAADGLNPDLLDRHVGGMTETLVVTVSVGLQYLTHTCCIHAAYMLHT